MNPWWPSRVDTPEYQEEWENTPVNRRWQMAVPTYGDDPAKAETHGWPVPSRHMLRQEMVDALDPGVRTKLDRYWGMRILDLDFQEDTGQDFPPLTAGSTWRDWQWADPAAGPREVLAMLVEVLAPYRDLAPPSPGQGPWTVEDCYISSMRHLLTHLEEILAGRRTEWEPAMLAAFFEPPVRPAWLEDLWASGRVPALRMPRPPCLPLRPWWMDPEEEADARREGHIRSRRVGLPRAMRSWPPPAPAGDWRRTSRS